MKEIKNVKELKEFLSQYPDDMPILQGDEYLLDALREDDFRTKDVYHNENGIKDGDEYLIFYHYME